MLDKQVEEFETEIEDNQWMRKMDLHIVPHPTNAQYPQEIELDYGMGKGVLRLTVRAALVGYLLRRWNIDCTEEASLKGGEYQLWLRNRQTFYNAENLTIAPSYSEFKQEFKG